MSSPCFTLIVVGLIFHREHLLATICSHNDALPLGTATDGRYLNTTSLRQGVSFPASITPWAPCAISVSTCDVPLAHGSHASKRSYYTVRNLIFRWTAAAAPSKLEPWRHGDEYCTSVQVPEPMKMKIFLAHIPLIVCITPLLQWAREK